MRILITGGCGFVGSNLACLIKEHHPDYDIQIIDNLKRRGAHLNLQRVMDGGISFRHGDIRIREDLEPIDSIDVIIDASAEPSVLAGVTSGIENVVQTNFNGTVHILDLARRCDAGLIFLSTSRVYSIPALTGIQLKEDDTRFRIEADQNIVGVTQDGISEDFPVDGYRTYYGTTKLASEMMIAEYRFFSGLKAVVNRCGVIAGPHQMGKVDQGVIALWVASHIWKQPLNYIGFGGHGKQVRDILHIDDLFRLVDYQIHNLSELDGKVFNVGGGIAGSISLRELTQLCREVVGNKIEIGKIDMDRPGDIPLYITNNSQVEKYTGWKTHLGPRQIVEDVFQWMHSDESKLESVFRVS